MNDIKTKEFVYKTFSDISTDYANNKILVSSVVEAIDFDEFVQTLEVPTYKSVDAIYEKNGVYHLIEFKNTNIADVNKEDKIIKKYKDTITLLKCRGIDDIHLKLVLVISQKKNRNNLKRSRVYTYSYKQRLYYYVNSISKYEYNNVLHVPFKFMSDREFDGVYK